MRIAVTDLVLHENTALPCIVAAPDFTSDEVVIHAASLLKGRSHALTEPVLAYAHRHVIDLLPASHVEVVSDQGLLGRVNGKICVLGGRAVMMQAGIDLSFLARETEVLHAKTLMVYWLSIGDHLAGLIAVPHPQ